jgi:predicted DNA-binding protein
MDKHNKLMFSFRIHRELYDYLKKISKKEYTTISAYLIDLIKKDKAKKYDINDNNERG